MLEREISSLRLDLRLARLGLTAGAERSCHGSPLPARWSISLGMRPSPRSQARAAQTPRRASVTLPMPLDQHGWKVI
jgi:hypothetical protein